MGKRDEPVALTRLIPMLPVSNLDASLRFYTQLGFTVEQRRDDWGWAMLRSGECRLMLDRSINTQPRAPRQSVIYLYRDDLRSYHATLREQGVKVPDVDVTFYDMQEFRVEDPDGNRLWIGQDESVGAPSPDLS